MRTMLFLLATWVWVAGQLSFAAPTVPVQIIHINDNHGRFEPADEYFSTCANVSVCFGGFAKQQSMVNILRAEAKAAGEDSLFLHAGDEFTGTLWDYIYAREGNMVVAPFLNGLGLDAFVLGNHEFDYGPIVTSYFIGNITTPVISCNTDVSKEPVLAGMVKPFIVKKLPISGATVGIIGFTTPFTNVTSSPGPNVTFAQPADVAGKCIADAKAAGAEIIIALTHIGYDEDVALAKVAAAQGIDLIVGGHSHTLLYTGKVPDILVSPPTKETDVVAGPYPTESGSPNGKSIPVTQALWASRYMGYIRVNFTPGVGAAVLPSEPILLGDTNSTNYVHSDANVSAMIAGLKGPLDGLTKTIVGDTAVFLDGNRADIRNEETNFGNLVTDAHVWYITNKTKFLEQYPNTPLVGHFNGGGIRTSIPVGNVTRGQVATALPFGNTLVLKLVSAADLLAALNNGVSQWTGDSSAAGRFPQVSQMRFSFNSSAPASNRVIRVQILDKSKLIELSKYNGSILVVMNNYVAAGGDGYTTFEESQKLFDSSVPSDQVVSDYIQTFSPVDPKTEGRIINCASGFNSTNALCQPAP